MDGTGGVGAGDAFAVPPDRWGNLVNVTSLFYLVPAVTALMDYLIFGNRLAALSVLGMLLIIVGLAFVFRKPADP